MFDTKDVTIKKQMKRNFGSISVKKYLCVCCQKKSIRNISLFVLLYECTKKKKKKIRKKHECTSNERTRRKRKFLFSFRRSADNHDLRDGHRHAGKYYCNRLSYCRWLINWSINCKLYRLRSRNKKNVRTHLHCTPLSSSHSSKTVTRNL